MGSPQERHQVDVQHPRCPYCHDEVGAEGLKQGCPSCMAWHHSECWAEGRACSACGFSGASAGFPRIAPRVARLVTDADPTEDDFLRLWDEVPQHEQCVNAECSQRRSEGPWSFGRCERHRAFREGVSYLAFCLALIPAVTLLFTQGYFFLGVVLLAFGGPLLGGLAIRKFVRAAALASRRE